MQRALSLTMERLAGSETAVVKVALSLTASKST
jgi:hypothetical protein